MKQIKNIRNFLLISLIAGGTWIGCDDANYSTLDTRLLRRSFNCNKHQSDCYGQR